ncbi:hypothetical protein WDW86_05260 [Bdellovibrionota bacterium FG-2]
MKPISIAMGCVALLSVLSGVAWIFEARQSQETLQLEHEQLNAQTRILSASFWSAVETVKTRALAVLDRADAHSGRFQLKEGPLLHWAEVEMGREKLVQVLALAQNPAWVAGSTLLSQGTFEDYYLASAAEKFNVSEIKSQGVSVLRIRQDALRSNEWLAFAFPAPHLKSAVLALVNPVSVFSFLKSWNSTPESANLRAYLIAKDGTVLAHSLGSYAGTGFAETPVFREVTLDSFSRGDGFSAATESSAIDGMKVLAASVRVGNLPLALVVEQVLKPPHFSRPLAGKLGFAGGLLTLLGLGLFARAHVKRNRLKRLVLAQAQTEERKAKAELAVNEARSLADLFILEPVSARAEPGGEADPHGLDELDNTIAELPSGRKVRTENDGKSAAECQVVERALISELQLDPDSSKQRQRERVILARFELESGEIREPRRVAHRLTLAVSELLECRSLFFVYHPGVKAAILQTYAGFPKGESPAAMSVPVTEEAFERISKSELDGKIAAFSEYPPLTRMLSQRLGVFRSETWAVVGYSDAGKEPALLGLIVMLNASTLRSSEHRQAALARMIRATRLCYENALLAQ